MDVGVNPVITPIRNNAYHQNALDAALVGKAEGWQQMMIDMFLPSKLMIMLLKYT